MNKTIFIIALLCLSVSLSAQFRLGVKATTGFANTPNLSKKFVSLSPLEIYNISVGASETRQSFGMSIQGGNDLLFVMADGLYTKSSQVFESTTFGQREAILDPAVEYSYSSSNVRLIGMAGVKLKGFRFGVGPEFSLVLDEKETLSELNGFEKVNSNVVGGFNFLIGYEINNHLQVDLRHTRYFNSIGSNYQFDGVPLDLKSSPGMFELTLGFYL